LKLDLVCGDDFRFLDAARAKEKTQVPRAAKAAAKRSQKQRKHDDGLQQTLPV